MNPIKGQHSIVNKGCLIHETATIWNRVHIREEVSIGEYTVIGDNVYIDKGVLIGNYCKIQNSCNLYNGVLLEDGVFFGPAVTTTNVVMPRAFVDRSDQFSSTIFRTGCSIGARSVIRCGVEIGAYALIGAGSVVTTNIGPHFIAWGSPARIKGYVCMCGEWRYLLNSIDVSETKSKAEYRLDYFLKTNRPLVCQQCPDNVKTFTKGTSKSDWASDTLRLLPLP